MDEKNQRKRTWERVLSEFTDDLWTEILLRLPIKTLLQFKSVSKSWFSIISSHRFATSHLANAAKDDQILIVRYDIDDYELEDEEDYFSLFHLGSGCTLESLRFPYSQGEYPPHIPYCRLIGSECGIVCVEVSVSRWRATKKDVDIYLWNPATKHSKIIPPHTVVDQRSQMAFGFGFDHVDLDFKVVRMVAAPLSPTVYLAEVYSSNRNTWRKIEPTPTDYPNYNHFDASLHGFLFTIGYCGMIAFDINKEVFISDINLPYSLGDYAYFETRVTEFKDSVATIVSVMYKRKIKLWTLDDEACLCGSGGVEASWTIMQVVHVGVRIQFVEGHFNDVQFLILDEDDDRFLYDSDKKATNVRIPPYFSGHNFFKYRKSLFSLVGFKRIKWDVSYSRQHDSSDSDVEIDE
ncbi:hypothetical protein DCAR_0832353 [Daucus carota subsp. sativus]|uniref:F-box domain-containing protein n=1 Tax=Daucus carota subsp. sativus TaxID=79200 RepID=A0AAF1BAW5_DAUCS|nr:hypothetical protein DCAR_0832353 [Daucus carota subsp. sativus]